MDNDAYKYNFYVGFHTEKPDVAPYVGTKFFASDCEADEFAFDLAIKKYREYEHDSNYDLMTWDDCYDELMSKENVTVDDVNEVYYGKVEDNVTFYWAKLEN